MEEEKEDWKESWIGWPSKNKSKSTSKSELKDTQERDSQNIPEISKDYIKKTKDYIKKEDASLGSFIYEFFAIVFGIFVCLFGIYTFSDYSGILLLMVPLGLFTYLNMSWFGRVLRGLEQNNNILKKILKEFKQ